ncbi:hypothetical protein QBA57_28670 [Streptomyces scabiei]|uniref:hypothetical protein n=1 Tax=Streptomyces scabiei TaxID=1930 RepID=UPI001B3420DF|nr:MULTISPECIES: hypothetical protein [Streptomyces]MBP5883157.1 hypothetical protein [Streptomyces sp. LBUM 1487]MDX2633313.1 hypothetical protein [Streptomyces scabiei]MDX3162734.1 hypothetical protein [Streptomyces scabiei]
MGLFRRAQSSRAYPAAGLSVTGDASRFRRAKTSGARAAADAGQAWEDRDRQQDRKGRWYRAVR